MAHYGRRLDSQLTLSSASSMIHDGTGASSETVVATLPGAVAMLAVDLAGLAIGSTPGDVGTSARNAEFRVAEVGSPGDAIDKASYAPIGLVAETVLPP